MHKSEADSVLNWLVANAHTFSSIGEVLGETIGRLNQLGFEIIRSNIYCKTLHPQVDSTLNVWRKGEGFTETSNTAVVVAKNEVPHGEGFLKQIFVGHGQDSNPAYIASPLYDVIVNQKEFVRSTLPTPSGQQDYPIFSEFVEAGGTDYYARQLLLTEENRGCLSWLTCAKDGFSSEKIDLLKQLTPVIALVISRHSAHHVTRTLLNTYLGRGPGELVLEGKIKQGDVQRLQAAVWFSDLRGFTKRAAELDAEQLVELLNHYFEAVSKPIQQEGGEILKYIGDAVLAIFPVTSAGSLESACGAAINACNKAQDAASKLNQSIQGDALEQGIALHIGEVQYGNIGAENRLDFTVIGEDVNIAARLEDLCATLRLPVLLSEEFAKKIPNQTEIIGEYALKGIPGKQTVCKLIDVN